MSWCPTGATSGRFRDLAIDAELACMTVFWAPPAAILYRREIVERAGGFRMDFRTLDDAQFLFDVASSGGRFQHAEHVGALYRVHPGSKSWSNPGALWSTALRKAMDAEEAWRRDGTLDTHRRVGIAGVYKHAVSGLFQAMSPDFHTAVRAAKEKVLRLSPKNRALRLLTRIVGIRSARRITLLYSATRRRLRGSPPPVAQS